MEKRGWKQRTRSEMVSSKVTRPGCGSRQGCLSTAFKLGHKVFWRKCSLQRKENWNDHFAIETLNVWGAHFSSWNTKAKTKESQRLTPVENEKNNLDLAREDALWSLTEIVEVMGNLYYKGMGHMISMSKSSLSSEWALALHKWVQLLYGQ